MLRILVADDHEGVRQAVRQLLEAQEGWQVVGEAASSSDALAKAVELGPDAVVLDISMPELDGISAARLIHHALPRTELVILSQHDAQEMVQKALEAGVRGYVLKADAPKELVPALEAVYQHQQYLSAGVSSVAAGLPASAASGVESRPPDTASTDGRGKHD